MAISNSSVPTIVACPNCGDLEPVDESNLDCTLNALWATADTGCESCVLLRHAIVDCIPEFIVDRDSCAVHVAIRRSILRDFIEVAVQSDQLAKTVILDFFITAGECCCVFRDGTS